MVLTTGERRRTQLLWSSLKCYVMWDLDHSCLICCSRKPNWSEIPLREEGKRQCRETLRRRQETEAYGFLGVPHLEHVSESDLVHELDKTLLCAAVAATLSTVLCSSCVHDIAERSSRTFFSQTCQFLCQDLGTRAKESSFLWHPNCSRAKDSGWQPYGQCP